MNIRTYINVFGVVYILLQSFFSLSVQQGMHVHHLSLWDRCEKSKNSAYVIINQTNLFSIKIIKG